MLLPKKRVTFVKPKSERLFLHDGTCTGWMSASYQWLTWQMELWSLRRRAPELPFIRKSAVPQDSQPSARLDDIKSTMIRCFDSTMLRCKSAGTVAGCFDSRHARMFRQCGTALNEQLRIVIGMLRSWLRWLSLCAHGLKAFVVIVVSTICLALNIQLGLCIGSCMNLASNAFDSHAEEKGG